MTRLMIALTVWAFIVLATFHTYGDSRTLNQGFYWKLWPTSHFCGYEWRGHPGFFCDVN